MSLILDALRKAEAERQRGAVPGLHGVTAPPPAEPAAGGGWAGRVSALRTSVPLMLALVMAALVLAAALGWWLARPGATPALPQAAAPTLPALPTPTPAAPSPLPLPLPSPDPAPLPLVVSAPQPVAPAEPAAMAASPVPAPAAAVASPAPPAASRAPIVTQVRRLAELAPEQRRELPALVVSGSVWSEQPGARFVVLDGQVLREGDRLAPGLVLVKLAPRSATLRWRDGLIEVPL